MEKEKIYVVTTCIVNTEEGTPEVRSNFIQATKNEKLAFQTMEELAEEVEENYEENDFACSEDEWETKNKKGITITREDLLEEIIIEIIEMEVE